MSTRKFKGDVLVESNLTVDNNLKLSAETASRALQLDASGNIESSAVTTTELGYLSGVTSAIQTQLNAKANDADVIKKDGSVAFTGDQSMGGNQLTNVGAPSASTDVATKGYVDSVAEGLKPKEAVRVATTAALSLATDLENGDSVDGVTLATGDRVLVKDQADASENGIYIVPASGAASRSSDFDSLTPIDEINGAYVAVQEGTANAGKLFVQTGTVATLDTDDIDFVFFNSNAALIGGDGITISGSTISVDHDGQGLTFSATQLALELDGSTLSKSASGLKLSDTAVTPGTYGSASETVTFTVDQQGRLTAASEQSILITASQVSDFNEAAQDAVGTILSDSSSIDFTYNDGGPSITAAVIPGGVDHDALLNFVANEHVDHSAVQIATAANTSGLTGGGDITTTRNLSVDINGTTAETSADNADKLLIWDNSASALKSMTRSNFLSGFPLASAGDINETSFSAANNQASPANVTGFAFANATVRSFSAHVSVSIDATSDLFETFDLQGVQKGSSWDLSVQSTGDESGIEFSITTAGQIQYTSSNVSGFVSNTIKFRAVTTSL